jgi:hypothetical protein
MRAAVAQISSKSISKSSVAFSTKNAWAAYVRERWAQNTLGMIQIEWDLTEGEARGLLYAQASQPTIDNVLDHKNGGILLGLDLLLRRFQTTANEVAEKLEERHHNERLREEARRQSERRALSRLTAVPRPGEVATFAPDGGEG